MTMTSRPFTKDYKFSGQTKLILLPYLQTEARSKNRRGGIVQLDALSGEALFEHFHAALKE